MSIHDIYEQRQNYFFRPSSTVRGGLIFCILMGVLAFFGAMYAGEATRAWGSFLFNLMFFFGLALGGTAFAAMQDVIGAKWGRPMMRLHESFASFLPIGAILIALFFLCIHLKIGSADEVYRWIKDPHMLDHFWGKKTWLQPGFMMLRNLGALVVILCLAFWQLRTKLRGDLALLDGKKDQALEYGLAAKQKLRYWSAPLLILYSLSFSILVFDLTMSLAPTWFSTLWAGWSFAVMMQTLMATLLIAMFMLRETALGQHIQRQHFHDIGKFMHGFTVFFAYLTYAHILTYWYGNVPEETEYFIHRLHGPWLWIVLISPFLVFVFPLFALIPKAAKWTSTLTIPICISILVAQWMIALLVVIPEVTKAEHWGLPWVELGAFLGFLGLFLASIFWFAKRYPMLALSDPLLSEALHEADHH